MKQYTPAREATQEERDELAKYLVLKEMGHEPKGGYSCTDEHALTVMWNAVEEASITVWPGYFKKDDLFKVIWPHNRPKLPNHAENFKRSQSGTFKLLPRLWTGWDKYKIRKP